MATQYFDDGSTLTYDYSPGGAGITNVTPATDFGAGSAITPGAYAPGSTTWLDVLARGLSRYADYRQAVDAPQNPRPVYAPTRPPEGASSGFGGLPANWMIYAGIALAGVAVLSALMKK